MTLRYDSTTRDILSPDNMIVATVSGIFNRADPALGYEMAAAKEMVEALELIQGFNWQLDDSPHGQEIKRRALATLARAKP